MHACIQDSLYTVRNTLDLQKSYDLVQKYFVRHFQSSIIVSSDKPICIAIYIVIDNQNGDDDITALLERQQVCFLLVTHDGHNL